MSAASVRCPVCVTPLHLPSEGAEFRCPFCTTTLYGEYSSDGVHLHKEKPQLPTAPVSEFDQLLTKTLAPPPDPKRVWQQKLFGLRGRVPRGTYWVGFAAGVTAYLSSSIFLEVAKGMQPGMATLLIALLAMILSLISLWLWLAVRAKTSTLFSPFAHWQAA